MRCKSAETIEDISASNVKTRRILITPSKTLKQALDNVTFTGFSANNDEEDTDETESAD
jgi:hypothetical protein